MRKSEHFSTLENLHQKQQGHQDDKNIIKPSWNHHKTTKLNMAQLVNVNQISKQRKQRHSNDSSKFLLRPHRLSFRNHHRWIPYAICRDEIAICRETGFHHLSSKQKKTRNPQPTSLRPTLSSRPKQSGLDPPWKSSRKKTKWLGLKKDDPWI